MEIKKREIKKEIEKKLRTDNIGLSVHGYLTSITFLCELEWARAIDGTESKQAMKNKERTIAKAAAGLGVCGIYDLATYLASANVKELYAMLDRLTDNDIDREDESRDNLQEFRKIALQRLCDEFDEDKFNPLECIKADELTDPGYAE